MKKLKKVLVVIVILALVLGGLWFYKNQNTPSGKAIVKSETADFRSDMALGKSALKDTLEKGDVIEVLGGPIEDVKTDKTWTKVRWKDSKGFIQTAELNPFTWDASIGINISSANRGVFATTKELEEFLVEKSISYGFIRLGGSKPEDDASYQDELAFIYAEAFNSEKVPFGFFWEYNPKNEEQAKKDMESLEVLIKIANKNFKNFKLPVFLCVEESDPGNLDQIKKLIKENVPQELEGTKIGIYTDSDSYQYLSGTGLPLWVSRPEKIYTDKFPEKGYTDLYKDKIDPVLWQFAKDQETLLSGKSVSLIKASESFTEAYLK